MKLAPITNINSELAKHSEFQPEPQNFLAYHDYPRHQTTKAELLSGRAFAVLVVVSLAVAAFALLH